METSKQAVTAEIVRLSIELLSNASPGGTISGLRGVCKAA